MSNFEDYPLLRTMYKLKASRFAAHERLTKKYKWHAISLVTLSIYAIALSSVDRYFDIDGTIYKDLLPYLSSLSSTFVVALSMYLAFSDDIIRAKYLHDNAKLVTNIYQQLKVEIKTSQNNKNDVNISEYEKRYAEVMNSCPYNHDQIDHEYSMSNDPHTDAKYYRRRKCSISFRQTMSKYAWPSIGITSIPLMLIFIVLLFS